MTFPRRKYKVNEQKACRGHEHNILPVPMVVRKKAIWSAVLNRFGSRMELSMGNRYIVIEKRNAAVPKNCGYVSTRKTGKCKGESDNPPSLNP